MDSQLSKLLKSHAIVVLILLLCVALPISFAQNTNNVRSDYLFSKPGSEAQKPGASPYASEDTNKDESELNLDEISADLEDVKPINCSEKLDFTKPIPFMRCDPEDLLSIPVKDIQTALLEVLPKKKNKFCMTAMGCSSSSAAPLIQQKNVTPLFDTTNTGSSPEQDEAFRDYTFEDYQADTDYYYDDENEKPTEEKTQLINVLTLMTMRSYYSNQGDTTPETTADEALAEQQQSESIFQLNTDGYPEMKTLNICRESKIEMRPLATWGPHLKKYEATWYNPTDYSQVSKVRGAKTLVIPYALPSNFDMGIDDPAVKYSERNNFWRQWALSLQIPCLPTRVTFLPADKAKGEVARVEYRSGSYAW
ncbi:MAG: hypothetical protein IT292_04665 [Deltaproteobacteria bacterium]|nr:hypothetical protein [Deltaproteobacteria bacterium]